MRQPEVRGEISPRIRYGATDGAGKVVKEAALPHWANLRQRVLDVAIAEITKMTDLNLEIESSERSPSDQRFDFYDQASRETRWCKVVKRPSGSALVPNFVEPMKAKLAGSIPTGAWTFEIKFDGYRALALRGGNKTRLLSRNEKDLGKKFPEIVNAIAALDVYDAIIDGEIVALDENGRPSFQLLQGFDMGQERPPIVYYAFDLLRLNGKDLRASPIEERKAKISAKSFCHCANQNAIGCSAARLSSTSSQ